MKIEDIKVGETYNVRVKVECIDEDGWLKVRTSEKAISFVLSPKEQEAFSPLPKYDPCRKLKVGDVVRVLKINGNLPKCQWAGNIPKEGVTGIVRELRKEDHFVWIDCKEIVGYCIDPAYLELVTPVEELEPYFVGESENSYDLFRKTSNGNQLRASFWWKHNPTPDLIELSKANAKAAAEAERDRLNAEYRKEQE